MGTAQRQPEVYRVETVPPPPGEDSAYSAPTKVGPFAQAALAKKMMLTSEEPRSGVQAVTRTAPPPRLEAPIAPAPVAAVAPPPRVFAPPPLFVSPHLAAPVNISHVPLTPPASTTPVLVTVLASSAVMAAAAAAWVVFVLGYFG